MMKKQVADMDVQLKRKAAYSSVGVNFECRVFFSPQCLNVLDEKFWQVSCVGITPFMGPLILFPKWKFFPDIPSRFHAISRLYHAGWALEDTKTYNHMASFVSLNK